MHTTTINTLQAQFAAGQRISLSDLIGARKAMATELADERAAHAKEQARRDAERAAAEQAKAARIAEAKDELRYGVFKVRADGTVYMLGALSDIDAHADGSGEVVEVEYDTGHRQWFPRAEVVLASEVTPEQAAEYVAAVEG